MENSSSNNPPPAHGTADEEATGFPGLPRWWMLYGFVTGIFVLYVVLLTTLTELYR